MFRTTATRSHSQKEITNNENFYFVKFHNVIVFNFHINVTLSIISFNTDWQKGSDEKNSAITLNM